MSVTYENANLSDAERVERLKDLLSEAATEIRNLSDGDNAVLARIKEELRNAK